MHPAFVEEDEDDRTSRACRALGVSTTRVEILRAVIAATEATTAQLMEQTGFTRGGVLVHLRMLARDGLVTSRRTTHPRGSGPITYWRADLDEVEDLIDTLATHLLLDTGGST